MLQASQNNIHQTNFILSDAQINTYERDGFLIIENFISQDICQLLIDRAQQLIHSFDVSNFKTIFSSADQTHAKSNYFLESGYDIRFFLEPNALDAHGNLLKEKLYAINKIGHALHDLDPIFNCFSRQHKLACLLSDLGIFEPLLLQSMVICKQPFIGDEVYPHQDSTYLYCTPIPVTGLWFALEDATIENGCLWALPGGHRAGLKARFVRHGLQTEEVIHDDTPWPIENMRALSVTRGSLIILHGLAPHMSHANKTDRSRYAFTLHIADKRTTYAPDNWLQRPADKPFRGFL